MAATTGGSGRYRVYISHTDIDAESGRRLETRLATYVLPRALRALRPGLQLEPRPLHAVYRNTGSEADRAALLSSDYLIVICSPAAAADPRTEGDILAFAANGDGANILAIVVSGAPNATTKAAVAGAGAANEALPRALRFELEPDGEGGVRITDRPAEPLWSDWRDATARDHLALLRIVAALLRLSSLDDLVQRDRRRRRQVMLARTLAAGAAALTLIVGGSWVVAMMQGAAAAKSEALATLARRANDADDFESGARFALAALAARQTWTPDNAPSSAKNELERAVQSDRILRSMGGSDGQALFYPDGKRLAMGDGVWDLGTRELAFAANGPHAISADGRTLAEGLTLADAATGKPLATLADPADPAGKDRPDWVAFSPDGRQLWAATGNGVEVWELASRQERTVAPASSGLTFMGGSTLLGPTLVTPSPDGARWAAIFHDHLWLADADGREVPVDDSLPGTVGSAAFSPDSRLLAVAASDYPSGERQSLPWGVSLLDARSGRTLRRLVGHDDRVNCAAFSRDGARIVTGSDDGTVRLWDVASGRQIGPPLRGSTGVVRVVAMSPDGARVAGLAEDYTVRVWDVATGVELAHLVGPPVDLSGSLVFFQSDDVGEASLVFSPDGHTLATALSYGGDRLWRVDPARPASARPGAAGARSASSTLMRTACALLRLGDGFAFRPDELRQTRAVAGGADESLCASLGIRK